MQLERTLAFHCFLVTRGTFILQTGIGHMMLSGLVVFQPIFKMQNKNNKMWREGGGRGREDKEDEERSQPTYQYTFTLFHPLIHAYIRQKGRRKIRTDNMLIHIYTVSSADPHLRNSVGSADRTKPEEEKLQHRHQNKKQTKRTTDKQPLTASISGFRLNLRSTAANLHSHTPKHMRQHEFYQRISEMREGSLISHN